MFYTHKKTNLDVTENSTAFFLVLFLIDCREHQPLYFYCYATRTIEKLNPLFSPLFNNDRGRSGLLTAAKSEEGRLQ